MDEHEKKLWQRYRRTKREPARTELRNALVELYLPLARYLAKRKAKRLPPSIDFDDLYSAAYQALLGSVPRFDLSRGYTPRTFFSPRINGAMIDWVRSIDPASRLTRERESRVNQWAQTELDHSPTDDEIDEHFGFRLYRPATLSLQEPRDRDEGRAMTLGDLVADRHCGPGESSISELSALLRGCTKRERLLLLLYHIDGMKMSDIGASIGVSESRISQMMSGLKTRLRDAHAA